MNPTISTSYGQPDKPKVYSSQNYLDNSYNYRQSFCFADEIHVPATDLSYLTNITIFTSETSKSFNQLNKYYTTKIVILYSQRVLSKSFNWFGS